MVNMNNQNTVNDVRVYRNYNLDLPRIKMNIYIAISECFDECMDSDNSVDKNVMIGYIMKKTKGHYNPSIINGILKEFER